jgi:protein phosphatase
VLLITAPLEISILQYPPINIEHKSTFHLITISLIFCGKPIICKRSIFPSPRLPSSFIRHSHSTQKRKKMDSRNQIAAHCRSDIGLRRKRNEDICAVCTKFQYFLVADGIGGSLAGDIASSLFLDVVSETLTTPGKNTLEESSERIKTCFLDANKRIQQHVCENPTHKGMGCTAELLIICGDEYILGHIGDSRTYSFCNNRLEQLTVDHTLVQQQLKLGIISEQQAKTSAFNNVLLRAVGVEPQVKFDLLRGKIAPETLFVLCTDGLYNMVPEPEIVSVLQYNAPLALKTEMLINMANNAGGTDNITVVLVDV